MIATIIITVVVTLFVVAVALNFSTPEKQLQRTIRHCYSLGDPQFRREMGVLLGPDIIQGNRIRALQNGKEIFPAMLAAIASAERTITFETYIYWSGKVGEQMACALAERAGAGVSVHVMLDWAGSLKLDGSLLEKMEIAGVHLHRYRPLSWYHLRRLNNRTHRKLLVVDGRVGFTGGVGIAEQWEGDAEDPEHWRDIHFRIDGPVVSQVQAAFNDNWIKSTGEVLNGPDYFPPLEPEGDCDAHLFVSSPAGGSGSMHLMYLMSIAAAKASIDLEAAYFVPDVLVSKALLEARRRGVNIRVLVPGPHIDSEIVRIASKRTWGPLLLHGVQFYVYQPTMMHNKVLIVDHEMVSVGSTNFDIRSFRLNDEASLNIYDHAFAARMTEIFETDLEAATPYTHDLWLRRPLREKLAELILQPIKSQL